MWRNSGIGKSAFGASDKSSHACFLDNYAINAAAFAHTASLKRIVGEMFRLITLEIVSESTGQPEGTALSGRRRRAGALASVRLWLPKITSSDFQLSVTHCYIASNCVENFLRYLFARDRLVCSLLR